VNIIDGVWYGNEPASRAARAALWPFARAYAAISAARGQLYDAGILRTEQPALATVSVGNLTVGGTGKTPFAAWLAASLQDRARPAIALRGYGEDEALVHRRLNPDVPVVAGADRASAIREAQRQGADVVVLDDAFQHRRIARVADIVLLSAEQLTRPLRLLPAGPWREPLSSAGRADLLVITRKSAGIADAHRAKARLEERFPGLPIATVHLAPRSLDSAIAAGPSLPLSVLAGAAVTAIAAIGEPGVFARQLEQLGARVSLHAFRDHHHFSTVEVSAIAARVPPDGYAVCTLKDAVKLGNRWPGPSGLWYVSQQLVVEQGAEDLIRLLDRVLDARTSTTITAG
jgi:tetraacyldisaccharide 4'-kinase